MSAGKVLIVEDDVFTALGMADILTFAGFKVFGPARRVGEALELGTQAHPDVAIFDIQLAGRRDGIEGADLMHRMLGIPVVFVSAHADPDTMERSTIADPVAYLPKPCTPHQLLQAVEAAVRGQSFASLG